MRTRIIQYLHRPNGTELGLTGTHDTYLLIKSDIDLHGLFPVGIQQEFIDVETQKPYFLKSAESREFRVNQMGEFYRDKGLRPGDDIVIQKIISQSNEEANNSKLFISAQRFNRITFIKNRQGYDIANLDVLPNFTEQQKKYEIIICWNGEIGTLRIEFATSDYKRSDSPEKTDYYRILFNDDPITDKHLILTLGEINVLSPFEKYEYHEIIWDN